jgi:hypothetical protein
MIPHERSLVENYKDKPFVILGVNSDADLDAYRKQAKEAGVTWRSFHDGAPPGPIATRWRVEGWPTLYLIDHEGVIRHRDIYGEEALDQAIAALVAKAEAAR